MDPSARDLKLQLRKLGYRVVNANNDVNAGIQAADTALSTGKLLVHPSCIYTIAEYDAYQWDEKATLRGEDKPLKVDDHLCDDTRYFCNRYLPSRGSLAPRRKPFGL